MKHLILFADQNRQVENRVSEEKQPYCHKKTHVLADYKCGRALVKKGVYHSVPVAYTIGVNTYALQLMGHFLCSYIQGVRILS